MNRLEPSDSTPQYCSPSLPVSASFCGMILARIRSTFELILCIPENRRAPKKVGAARKKSEVRARKPGYVKPALKLGKEP